MGETSTATRAQSRVAWADVAKGVCILLVVLWHVIMKHYLQIDWRSAGPIPAAWGSFSEQLLPLRMPLFFAISGFFAVNAVQRPWRVVARTRVAKFFYLYALWLCIHTAVLALVPDFHTERATGPRDLLAQLTIAPTNLWYLSALALYFVFAKLVRRVPTALVLAAAFVLSAITASGFLDVPGNRGPVYQNLVFFLAGLYGKPLMERLADRASWPRLAMIGVPYAVLLVVIAAFDAKTWLGLWPLASGIAIVAALIRPLSAADPHIQFLVAVGEPIVLLVTVCLALRRFLPVLLFDLPTRAVPATAPRHRAQVSARTGR
ncbi:acyltransferase family protein [Kribbella sp. NPDC051718]|uniref:acyltransferase family protein n=1 Tax=Kribbella sp. NPDC051718 TaxID=3155168 RepID=UPI00342EB2FF